MHNFQTPMGRRFYEHTVPELVKQIERVAEALEAKVAKKELEQEPKR